MFESIKEIGLYWHPLGGNNIDQISGHCYHYFSIEKDANDSIKKTSIIIDIGKFDNHSAFGIEDSYASVPDLRFLLKEDNKKAKAIFLTHAHPDHINGIVHYIKAGYRLPPIYSGTYTLIILKGLFEYFNIPKEKFPKLVTIKNGDKINIGNIEVEAISSSHTCFDSLGFIINSNNTKVYHTGDMKTDSSTYFRKPTNIKRLKELGKEIDFVVADFCQIFREGKTPREVETFKIMLSYIKKHLNKKIFIPVYPTHPEMYIIAFLAALKMKKNVIFNGSNDFYSYLDLIIKHTVSFDSISKGKINILYKPNHDTISKFDNNYVVIGDFRNIDDVFGADSKNSFAIITSKLIFDPLRKELKSKKIHCVDVNDINELQGHGHGFIGDYKYINEILHNPKFIPTHCPSFVVDNFRDLAKITNINIINETPSNNVIYKLDKDGLRGIYSESAKWLVVSYKNDKAIFTEVLQVPTAGKGKIRSTISNRRSLLYAKKCINIEKRLKNEH